jgi:hypothetical protein
MFSNPRQSSMTKILFTGLILRAMNANGELAAAFNQPSVVGGAIYQSSRWDPDGSDYDQYVWDDFTLQSATSISEIHWVGAYDPAKSGTGGKVIDFSVAVYPSIVGGSQPDVSASPLFDYRTNGNANEQVLDTPASVRYYKYSFVLPTPFDAAGQTKYWIRIEGMQHGIPDWGIAAATGGDGEHFRRTANAGDIFYQAVQGDAAFSLVSQSASTTTTGWRDPRPGGILSTTHVTFSPMGGKFYFASTGRIFFVEDLLGRTMRGVGTAGLMNANGNVRLPSGMFIIKSAENAP